MALDNDIADLTFDVRRSIRYHNRRRGFYDSLNSIVTAISVIMGSATVYGVLKNTNLSIITAIIVTVFSTINLVFGSAGKARLHHDLSKRFIALEKKITLSISPNESDLVQWKAERLDIEAEEPPILRVLDVICYNEQVRAMGDDSCEKIGHFQRLLAPFIDFRADTIGRNLVRNNGYIYYIFIFFIGLFVGHCLRYLNL